MRVSQVDGWNKIPPVRDGALRAQGLVDNRSLVAIEPDGTGCCLASFHAEPVVFRKEEGHLLRGLFRHFGAAHRLQRKRGGGAALPDLADAVLDSAGRLHHVRGAAGEPALRGALRAAVLATEESRGRRRREDPHGALSAWECLVAGRWTFVDHFDHDGRRYVLALENSVRPPAFDLLSPRERDVVEHALRGSDNKVIAYDLGIAHATVKVLMTRAAAKLGVRTRRELLAKMKAHLVRR